MTHRVAKRSGPEPNPDARRRHRVTFALPPATIERIRVLARSRRTTLVGVIIEAVASLK